LLHAITWGKSSIPPPLFIILSSEAFMKDLSLLSALHTMVAGLDYIPFELDLVS